jgi:histidyl-tRNA synthetase
MPNFDPLPGFRDFYPEECQVRNFIFAKWRQVCRAHNFVEYVVPTLQPTELFTVKSGPEIVGQLFNFKDKGDREVTLPAEITPYAAVMIGARAASLKRPIRWFSIPQCFRYERMQKGRGREFYQLNADIFDEPGTTAEVEIISFAIDIFRAFGLTQKDFVVRLSDRTLWLELLFTLGISLENAMIVLQTIDKWEREDPAEIKKKLEAIKPGLTVTVKGMLEIKSLDALEKLLEGKNSESLTARLDNWKALLADLATMGLSDYIGVDLSIVRGLAYYTGFVFEVFEKDDQGGLTGRALAGGGRFNDLVKKLGGPDMPAVGIGMSDVTLLVPLAERSLLPKFVDACDLYLAYTSPTTRAKALELLPKLRDAGFSVEISLKSLGFGKQMKAADKAGARKVLILGDDELSNNICKVKELTTGKEIELPLEKLIEGLRG